MILSDFMAVIFVTPKSSEPFSVIIVLSVRFVFTVCGACTHCYGPRRGFSKTNSNLATSVFFQNNFFSYHVRNSFTRDTPPVQERVVMKTTPGLK